MVSRTSDTIDINDKLFIGTVFISRLIPVIYLKETSLVAKVYSTARSSIKKSNVFHTDRGKEFKNKMVDEKLKL